MRLAEMANKRDVNDLGASIFNSQFTGLARKTCRASSKKMAAVPDFTGAEPPPFVPDKHRAYIKRVSNDSSAYEFAVSERTQPSLTRTAPVHHALLLTKLVLAASRPDLRMSGVYWGAT